MALDLDQAEIFGSSKINDKILGPAELEPVSVLKFL